ncbi:MAG TPA: hypothetical protein VHE80_00405 [Acidimicrobiales bacterium]|nr:hypothetical protein [Acidimicrobiales bacterium]
MQRPRATSRRRVPLRWAAVVAAAALLVVVPVPAGAAPSCPGGTPFGKGQAALDMLRYPWGQLGYSIQFLDGHPRYLGATYEEERRIEIFVGRCQSVTSVARVVGHEVGHAVDFTYNDGARRQEWARIRGFDAPWAACELCPDYTFGAGDFAEVFAYLKATPGQFRSKLAGPPSPAQAAELERFFHPSPLPVPAPRGPSGLIEVLSRLLPSFAPLL